MYMTITIGFRSSEDTIKSQGYTVAPVHIGKHVWIGSNVVILKRRDYRR